ncbi:MAG: 2,3-bisphosphoglycerate-independent phosphoglycerate mutase [Candidatus Sungiibacteriota bacterium]
MPQPLLLVILDGFGVSQERAGNPVAEAQMPALDEFARRYPFTALQASGVAVGLPWGTSGNSEVGHLTMGAGRVVYHHLPRIIHAIRDGSFFENAVLKNAVAHVRGHRGKLHIAGLVSSGSVHSYLDHLEALLEFAKREGVGEVLIHVFTDGKDAPIKGSAIFLAAFEKRMAIEFPTARFVSVIGRFYAMDRDEKWDRVRSAYEMMTQAKGAVTPSVPTHLTACYEQGETDEFISPAVVSTGGTPPVLIQAGDALLFFNFREDSMREITRAFVEDGFDKFPREKIADLFVATMTEYEKGLSGAIALFPTIAIAHPLGAVIADAGLRQLRIAETEKYAHVTYFFNGGEEQPFVGEDRILVPSLSVAHFDDAPEMRAADIAAKVVENMEQYDVIIANFANADMIGHSGNFKSAVQAVEALDEALGTLANAVINKNWVMIITADHGNVESKRNAVSGENISKHSTNPVPFFIIGERFRRATARSDGEIVKAKSEVGGILTDVAPTALAILGLAKPAEMTGQNLLPLLVRQ